MRVEFAHAEQAVREAEEMRRRLKQKRVELMWDARDMGWSMARIDELAGVSQQRVSQILREE